MKYVVNPWTNEHYIIDLKTNIIIWIKQNTG